MASISVVHPSNRIVSGRKVHKNIDKLKVGLLSRQEKNKRNKKFKFSIPLINPVYNSQEKVDEEKKNEDEFEISMIPPSKGCCCNKSQIPDTDVLKKALNAATLAPRVAEIFAKARDSNKVDAQKEKREGLMKRLQLQEEEEQEDELKASAQIRSETEELKKKKEEAELREKERESARVALQMMEKTAAFEDNLMILKELEMLSQCSPTYILRGCDGPAVMLLKGFNSGSEAFNPLEQLGLRLKEEYLMDVQDDEETFLRSEIEEGEILEY